MADKQPAATKAPPVSIEPCPRCGQFIDKAADRCWVCGYPETVPAPQGSPPMSAWKVVVLVLFTMAAAMALGVALLIALFFLCLYAITGGGGGSFH